MNSNEELINEIDDKLWALRKLLKEVKLTSWQRKRLFYSLDNLKEMSYKRKPQPRKLFDDGTNSVILKVEE